MNENRKSNLFDSIQYIDIWKSYIRKDSHTTAFSSIYFILFLFCLYCTFISCRRITTKIIKLRRDKTVQSDTFNPLPLLIADEIGGED